MPDALTKLGKNLMAYSLKSTRDWGYPTHMETGSGTTPPNEDNVALESPHNNKTAFTYDAVDETAHTFKCRAYIPYGSPTNVAEVGIWVLKDGTWRLVARSTFTTQSFGTGEAGTFEGTFDW